MEFREMRRFGQQLTEEETRAILERGSSGVLSVSGDGGYPYGVPVSYALSGNCIYFHGANVGHKIESIRKEPKVCFTVIDQDKVLPEKSTTVYRSAVAFGIARVLSDPDEIRKACYLLGEKYSPGYEEKYRAETEETLSRIGCVEIEITHLTGKEGKESKLRREREFPELFYKDSYLREFEAQVISCEEVPKKGYAVELSQTAFYPEGGGQNADTGYLGDVRVLDVRKKDGRILHYTDRPLAAGDTVKGVIDWERRYTHMQNHTGEHILSGLIHQRFGCDNVGFHMSDVITIDFNAVFDWQDLMELEDAANRIIWSNIPLEELYPSDKELSGIDYRSKKELSGQVRLIRIPGADLCACCGTHVRNTGEVGMIKCLSMIHYKGGVRIEIVSGQKALLDYRKKADSNAAISRALSAKPDETDRAILRIKDELESVKERAAQMTKQYIELRLRELSGGKKLEILFEENLSANEIRRLCDRMMEEGKADVCAVLSPKDENAWQYVLGSGSVDMREKSKELNRILSGRGGGMPQMVQGQFLADKKLIQETLETMFS